MKLRIYQINEQRDRERVMFLGGVWPDPVIYDLVFDGDVPCRDEEEVFALFNDPRNLREIRDGSGELFRGRHLSVSDVIELTGEDGKTARRFVEPIGFRTIVSPSWERHFREMEK